jgi:hypothetical protein
MSETATQQAAAPLAPDDSESMSTAQVTTFHHLHFDPRARTWRGPTEVVLRPVVIEQDEGATDPRAA